MHAFVLLIPFVISTCLAATSSAALIESNAQSLCSGPNARTRPPAGAIVVDATGTYNGSFLTVVEGVANIPNTTEEHTLFMFPGVYKEQVSINPLNGPLVLQGYTCDTTSYAANEVTITHAKVQRDIPPEVVSERNYLTSTLGFRTSNVRVYNLNVANTAGKIEKSGQAVAVFVNSTNFGFYGCNMTGYQDTLCANRGPELYARSFISGAVDFIFGLQAKAWFESCDIESIGKGYITANGNSNSSNLSEYVFNRAHVFGTNGTNSTYLGRPWRPYARVVWQNSDLSDVVKPEGWKRWDNISSTDNIYFKEFNNSGPGAATDKRVEFSGQLTEPVAITEILGEGYASEWWVDTDFL